MDLLDVVHGIQNSCNVFFSEMGHRLSMDENGNYSPELGIEKIRKYASMFDSMRHLESRLLRESRR